MKGKGNNALAAAIDPGKKRFAERYQAALIHNGGEGDKAALAELDMFRKDVGSFVRLYDFMSPDHRLRRPRPWRRSRSICGNLDRVIQPDNYTAPIDLSDVVLKQVKQIDSGQDRHQPRRCGSDCPA